MSFAKIIAYGNLTRDPESRYTTAGSPCVSFTLAADGRKRGENTTFFRVTAWDRLAERLYDLIQRGYIGKGKGLYIEGQLESRAYTDNSGQQRTSLDVTLTDFQFVGGSGVGEGRATTGQVLADDEPINDVPF